MKILFVADVSIAGVIGGAERVLFEQSTRLVQRGYDVHIMTRQLPGHRGPHEEINGVKEWRYEIDPRNAVSYLKSTWVKSKYLFESLQRQHRFDVVVFEQPFSALGVVQSPLRHDVKKIYICFSLSFEEFVSRNKKPDRLIAQWIYQLNITARKYLEKKALKNSDKIIVLSQFTIDKLNPAYKIPAHKYAILPGGVDLDRFQPVMDKESIRKKLRLPAEKVILFTVRNLVPRMGLEYLIEAMRAVRETSVDSYLVIGGAGPLTESLSKLAKGLQLDGHIRFEGFIPEELLPEYYRMADLFILPTKELEGFGLVTLEAMASGLPVLGTPVGGTKEILGKFDSRFLFRDTTSASMAELISEKYRLIKERPEEWKAVAQKCRRFVEDNYSWDTHVDALENLF